MNSVIEEIATDLAAEQSAAQDRQRQAMKDYGILLASPGTADAKDSIRALVKELRISPGDFQKHAKAFDELRKARDAAPSPQQLTNVVEARCAAERAVTDYEYESDRRIRELVAARGAATADESRANTAITDLRELERLAKAMLETVP
jgi:hypothetical protein